MATLPVLLWGGVNGMKVSVFLSLLVAGFGQWALAHVFGLRGLFRLWSALLFALSGGLMLLWVLGWYELLVGAAWFPWCFALLWVALNRPGRRWVVAAALAVALVLTTGGGYYPLYLAVALGVLTLAALIGRPGQRRAVLRRALAVAGLGLALSAVYLLPLIDGWRYTARDAAPDVLQVTSQPITHALFNTVIFNPEWFRAEVLNKGSSWGWYYLGWLPLLALAFVPWVFGRFRWRRRGIVAMLLVLLALLLWSANRHAPVLWLYDRLPALLSLRFPGRLVIIATSPLLVLAAVGLQGLVVTLRGRWRGLRLGVARSHASRGDETGDWVNVLPILTVVAAAVLLLSLSDVYRVNRTFGMHPHPLNAVAGETLAWLHETDPELYYVDIGRGNIYWDWMPHAYLLEMPVLNFRYNRRVLSMDAQYALESPFNAQPRYTIISNEETPPDGAQLLRTFEGVGVWRRDDVLPFAFVAAPARPIAPDTVRPAAARLDGPNRLIVTATAEADGEQLVALVSDYPGWRVWVDGQPAALRPVNGYLGVALAEGEQTVVFAFQPMLYYAGLGVSLLALLGCAVWLVRGRRARQPAPAPEPPPTVGDHTSPE